MENQNWFTSNNVGNKVNPILWLKALGLPNQTIAAFRGKQAPRTKILDNQQLRKCQNLISQINQEMNQGRISVQQKIEAYRKQDQLGMSP